ncbi:type III PLP-dependent enzyme [Roseobacter sp.]|uniref:type III PLP-dependent enzyme n=1 Tax=Roseobacter sp. TaxID=1907202 RepID=UPI00385BC277
MAPLLEAANTFGTPLYVYNLDMVQKRLSILSDLFGNRFGISYAIKANPNPTLLAALQAGLSTFDASSFAEVIAAIDAGMPAKQVTFSGPAKREAEIKGAIVAGVGELVVESLTEAKRASSIAKERGVNQNILVRINPLKLPRKFGASMGATASQFGIDEEDLARDLPIIRDYPNLNLIGFHIYSGTNCLVPEAIAENFAIFADIFRAAQEITGVKPKRLVFGSGFGIPYLPGEDALDHAALPALINPIIDDLLDGEAFNETKCNLELGRWLVGPAGWLLTRVISEKHSRGVEVRTCDAGFNAHLAACGMMGSVIRRNWDFENLSNAKGQTGRYMLTGPLCTSIDRLAMDIELPKVSIADVLSIASSGAYGYSASPRGFISHPEPREVVIENGQLRDATPPLARIAAELVL